MNKLRAALCVLSVAGAAACAETLEKSSQPLQAPERDDGDAAAGEPDRLVIDATRPPMELPAQNDGDAPDDVMDPPPPPASPDPRADAGSRTEPEPERDAAALDSSQPLDAAQDATLERDAFVEPGTELLGAAALAGAFETLRPNHFWATPIQTSVAVSVRSFGIVGEADNGLVRFAIYSDTMTPEGHYPDALVALGIGQSEVLEGFAEEVAPIGFVPLEPEATYWLVIVSGSNPASIAVHDAAVGTDVIHRAFPDGHNFSSPFPAAFPNDGTGSPGKRLGVYVRVRAEE
jgi:hypothetical protein